MSDSATYDSKEELIEKIILTHQECAEIRERLDARRRRSRKIWYIVLRRIVRLVLGRKLLRSFEDLLGTLKRDISRFPTRELSRLLDAATSKFVGEKRWVTILSIAAAIPAVISLVLLAEEKQIAVEQKKNAEFTARLTRRSVLLSQIYNTTGAIKENVDIFPLLPNRVRKDAVLSLIDLDTEILSDRPTDVFGEPSHINLASAPLAYIDFSPGLGESPLEIYRVAFSGSGFQLATFARVRFDSCNFLTCEFDGAKFTDAVFENCIFQRADFRDSQTSQVTFKECDFRNANLKGANFEKAAFSDGCLFENAVFDESTRWPQGVDAEMLGAISVKSRRDKSNEAPDSE